MAPVQGLCFLNQDPSLVPELMVNPVLRLPVGHGMPAPLSGGPADPPQGTQYNSISDISSQEINLLSLKHPAPALATTETLQVVQKVKIREGGSQGRVSCSDFGGLYSAVIQLAAESHTWSGEAWNVACRANGVRVEYDEDAYKLIKLCGSNLWSELKTLMCPLMAAKFGFIDEKIPAAIKLNAVLAAAVLVNHKNLTYKDCQQCKGAFEAKLIKKVSMGVKYPSYFKDGETGGVTFGIIVVLLTAAEACLMDSDSKSGLSYYDLLVRFYKGTKQAEIVSKICKKLLKSVCHHASIPNDPIATGFTEQFTMDKFAAAAAEWEY
ncbi:hypothetical protein DFJ58DRAFT_731559 [Suillus subalutaceus]|uniref:uncharacterized protein n=1 Tax=Suillus subalutaceus TaxID=48586 RepID=UPI001B87A998|nr:uncharacterized protein DFJ58DRAFT_731559 [Suillus subalutaceus]KAG1843616.1 hypothetical protein DFJ58DRAFT_731559 [Suillus subalutaceus]